MDCTAAYELILHIQDLVWTYHFFKSERKGRKEAEGPGLRGQSTLEKFSYLHSESVLNTNAP